ncbi:DUF1800 family protein [uncultured Flavobacterium sp.]|uniref:DUF1800 family protein n=1 Tax=uncultured Flavobacterium sp. TaxID=165435 RepID=UPI0030CA5469
MASLNPNTNVLGNVFAKHLLRRASFVYSKTTIDQFSGLTPSQALDLLLFNSPLTLPLPYDPTPTTAPDGYWTESTNTPSSFNAQARKRSIIAGWWWFNAVNSPTLKYKLCHFLSTRFTVEKSLCGASTYFYDHIRLLLFYSLGNYKSLAKKMTLDNSMLIYLNNTSNSKTAPNENYAREFLELFTIGKGPQIDAGNYTNFTEADIVQAARVLTGFRYKSDRSVIDATTGIPKGYNAFSSHDNIGSKVFSSAFGNTTITSATDIIGMDTELNSFVDMVFNQQATAKNICRKMYMYFVKSTISTEVETDIITPLANDLFNNGYEIIPIIRKLLESQHFYDLDDTNATDETLGGIIKSPLQQISEIVTYLKATIPDPTTNSYEFYINFWNNFAHDTFLSGANMILFDPDNVAGHPAYYQSPSFDQNWISSSTLIAKYRLGESLLDGINRISGNANIKAKINISDVIKNGNLISNASDAYILTSELCNALFAQVPDADRINYFMNSFLLQGLADYYWTSAWGSYLSNGNNSVVEPRLKLLVTKLLSAPESQLF